jgi:DNA-binding HxlR family transcriptional regulator
MKKNENNCPVATSLKLLGGKWTLQIIYEIGHEKRRFGELKRLIPEISEKMLIQELKKMADSKIIHRKAYPQIPPKVEYTLTERGLKVLPILKQIEAFGLELLSKP